MFNRVRFINRIMDNYDYLFERGLIVDTQEIFNEDLLNDMSNKDLKKLDYVLNQMKKLSKVDIKKKEKWYIWLVLKLWNLSL